MSSSFWRTQRHVLILKGSKAHSRITFLGLRKNAAEALDSVLASEHQAQGSDDRSGKGRFSLSFLMEEFAMTPLKPR